MTQTELDTTSGVPLYRQIKEILRTEIAEKVADPASPMTEALLLERFEVSRAPIRQALRELVSEGYVYRKQGKGTFPVPGVRVNRPADLQPGTLYQYLSDQGLHPASTVTDVERAQPRDAVRERLGLEPGELLLHFWRRISVDGGPIAHAEVFVRAPEDFTPTAADLAERGSAFELLERDYGITLERAVNEAWATGADAAQAEALGVEEGSPLLAIETVFFTVGGVPAGWRAAVHRAEEFKYQFVTGQ